MNYIIVLLLFASSVVIIINFRLLGNEPRRTVSLRLSAAILNGFVVESFKNYLPTKRPFLNTLNKRKHFIFKRQSIFFSSYRTKLNKLERYFFFQYPVRELLLLDDSAVGIAFCRSL